MYTFGEGSEEKLKQLHPDLVAVLRLAITITPVDFSIVQTARTYEQQVEYFNAGKSNTLVSRHIITPPQTYCHAVDVCAWINHQPSYDKDALYNIAGAVKESADLLKIPVIWGGDWKPTKKMPDADMPHYELPWSLYPLITKRE